MVGHFPFFILKGYHHERSIKQSTASSQQLNQPRLVEQDYYNQRPYRKDRLPRAYFCCRQLAKFRIVLVHWLVCYKPAGQSFPYFEVWVSVDFDSKYKIVWGETRDHRIPILEEIKKLKKMNLHNYSNISTPHTIRLTQLGWRGQLSLGFLADCLIRMQKWPVVGSSFH